MRGYTKETGIFNMSSWVKYAWRLKRFLGQNDKELEFIILFYIIYKYLITSNEFIKYIFFIILIYQQSCVN